MTDQKSNDWQPIETAPNDRQILVGYETGDVWLCSSIQNNFRWVAYSENPDREDDGVICATHWMDIPPVPKAAS
ncbi:MAG: hypothetical protein AAF205_00185 [Pseudomonadota bacterium]